ncbi:MAG: radical SAM protein [Anaerolineae bacterium]|nr:radical SAM protein [Anaerolineae bacterium]
MKNRGQVLLVNPWIYDFAAYNLWIEPLGLLTISAALRAEGYGVAVIDCLAPGVAGLRTWPDGRGKFLKTEVDRPEAVAFVPRRYGRYGLPVDAFDAQLRQAPVPDLVLVASGMTYWYPGVVEVIRRVRAHLGDVPVGLGGVYATLCTEHARAHTGADRVLPGPALGDALALAAEATGGERRGRGYDDPTTWPAPAHEMVPRSYAGLLTAWGCPYRCTYCAGHRLQPVYARRPVSAVVNEIVAAAGRGVRDFAFYDDALLLEADRHLVPILDGVVARDVHVRFHTPNGLHAREVTRELAGLMRRAGFATVRLSLETVDTARQRSTGGKVTGEEFARAAAYLREAGFEAPALGAYVLAGLPGQPLGEVEESVRFCQQVGVQPRLALFSPIPGTPDGDRALPVDADPLWHNDTVYPYLRGASYVEELQRIKIAAKGIG